MACCVIHSSIKPLPKKDGPSPEMTQLGEAPQARPRSASCGGRSALLGPGPACLLSPREHGDLASPSPGVVPGGDSQRSEVLGGGAQAARSGYQGDTGSSLSRSCLAGAPGLLQSRQWGRRIHPGTRGPPLALPSPMTDPGSGRETREQRAVGRTATAACLWRCVCGEGLGRRAASRDRAVWPCTSLGLSFLSRRMGLLRATPLCHLHFRCGSCPHTAGK